MVRAGKTIRSYEQDDHCQHPHNLGHLCLKCHHRYDDKQDERVTHSDVRTAKETAIERLLEQVARDVALAEGLKRKAQLNRSADVTLAQLRTMFATGTAQTYQANFTVVPDANTVLLAPGLWVSTEDKEPASGFQVVDSEPNLTMPITAEVIRNLVDENGRVRVPVSSSVEWEDIPCEPEEWECSRGDGAQAQIEMVTCAKCATLVDGPVDGDVLPVDDGTYQLSVPMPNPRTKHDLDSVVALACNQCGSTEFQVEFGTWCDHCEHAWAKLQQV